MVSQFHTITESNNKLLLQILTNFDAWVDVEQEEFVEMPGTLAYFHCTYGYALLYYSGIFLEWEQESLLGGRFLLLPESLYCPV